jgi:hypothetical protein
MRISIRLYRISATLHENGITFLSPEESATATHQFYADPDHAPHQSDANLLPYTDPAFYSHADLDPAS